MVKAIIKEAYVAHMLNKGLIGNVWLLDITEASDDEAYVPIYKLVYGIQHVFKLQLFYLNNKPFLKQPILVGVQNYTDDKVTFLHLPDKTDNVHQEITFRKYI